MIAQTFDIDIPNSLLTANNLESGEYNIKRIDASNFKYKVIRDIAYPILNGEIGTVRLGIVEEHIQQDMSKMTRLFLIMIVAFLIIGLTAALFFSYLITSPIKKISQKAQIIDLNVIDSEDYQISGRKRRKLFNVYIYDEMDTLVTKFSEMLSRLKNSYLELNKTQRALVQTEKLASLGTLSAGVAHEINNPLSGIKNCANRIIKNPQNVEQTVKYVELINDATDKIETVVQQLLKFSRKQDIVLDKIDLNLAIKSAISLTSHKLKSNQIAINATCKEDCFVDGSQNHLEQVFVNLILNGLDAIQERKEIDQMHSGEIIIEVKCDLENLKIHFKDNGIGIPEEIQSKVFDPFFTSKKVGKGTGLGLSVSISLIKEHNGKIYFKSSEGLGTEFIIELPLHSK